MKILRVVKDYWPCVGGNERWNFQSDRWFSEVAGDDVSVLVLRTEHAFQFPGYRDLLQGWRFTGAFQVPALPKVKAFQTILPNAKGIELARHYHKLLRPWVHEP